MSALSRVTSTLDRARRRLLWHRRALAALAAGITAYVAVLAATAPPPATVPAWVAAHDLPGGTVVGHDDLARRDFLPASLPDHRLRDPAQVVGRTTVAPISRGTALSADQVVGGDWLTHRPGLSAVPVRITDAAVVPLLRAGDRVDLVATDPQHGGSEVLAGATILAVPAAQAKSDGAIQGRLVVVGVPPERTGAVAAASAGRFVTVVWSR